jgi:hypothetical protein
MSISRFLSFLLFIMPISLGGCLGGSLDNRFYTQTRPLAGEIVGTYVPSSDSLNGAPSPNSTTGSYQLVLYSNGRYSRIELPKKRMLEKGTWRLNHIGDCKIEDCWWEISFLSKGRDIGANLLGGQAPYSLEFQESEGVSTIWKKEKMKARA